MVFHFSVHAILIEEIHHRCHLNSHTYKSITIEKVFFLEMVHLLPVSLHWVTQCVGNVFRTKKLLTVALIYSNILLRGKTCLISIVQDMCLTIIFSLKFNRFCINFVNNCINNNILNLEHKCGIQNINHMSSHVAYITRSSSLRILESIWSLPCTENKEGCLGSGIASGGRQLHSLPKKVFSSSGQPLLAAYKGVLQLGPGERSHWYGEKHSTGKKL